MKNIVETGKLNNQVFYCFSIMVTQTLLWWETTTEFWGKMGFNQTGKMGLEQHGRTHGMLE